MAASHPCADGPCCSCPGTVPGVQQTLEEMDFERGEAARGVGGDTVPSFPKAAQVRLGLGPHLVTAAPGRPTPARVEVGPDIVPPEGRATRRGSPPSSAGPGCWVVHTHGMWPGTLQVTGDGVSTYGAQRSRFRPSLYRAVRKAGNQCPSSLCRHLSAPELSPVPPGQLCSHSDTVGIVGDMLLLQMHSHFTITVEQLPPPLLCHPPG